MRGNSPSTAFSGLLAGYFTAGLAVFFVIAGVGLLIVAFLIYAGLCALGGGLLIFLASRWIAKRRGDDDPPGFPECFRAAYWGYLIALLIDMGLTLATDGLGAIGSVSPTPANPETVADVFALDVLRDFASWLWPGVPVTTLLLAVEHRMYRGLAGVARGLAITVTSLPGSLLLPLAILVGWEQRVTGIGGFADFGAAILALGILLAVFALVGAVPAGAVLRVASRRPGGLPPASRRRAYATAVLALVVWGAVTAVVMFVLPLFDLFSDHLWAMGESDGPLGYLLDRPWLVPAAAVTFGLLQTPGVLMAARVVEARLAARGPDGSRIRGPKGIMPLEIVTRPEPSVAGMTALATATTWPLALILAWLLVSRPY